MTEQGARALYESLARFQWWRRTLQRAAPGSGLEMRKHLNAPQAEGPSDGRAGLDEWLMRQIDGQPQRILDLGCGFGASLLRWLPQPSHGDEDLRHAFGITPSAYQVRRARQVADRAGGLERGGMWVGGRQEKKAPAFCCGADRGGGLVPLLPK